MEELKIIMDSLSKMSDGAATAFMWWCIKEVFASFMLPLTVAVIGTAAFKCIIEGIKTYNASQ